MRFYRTQHRFRDCRRVVRALFASLCLFGFIPAQATAQLDQQQLLQQAHNAEEKHRYAEAEGLYRRALAAAPSDLEMLKQLGLLYQKELKFDESIALFNRVLEVNPQFPEVNLFEGISYLGTGNFSYSIE